MLSLCEKSLNQRSVRRTFGLDIRSGTCVMSLSQKKNKHYKTNLCDIGEQNSSTTRLKISPLETFSGFLSLWPCFILQLNCVTFFDILPCKDQEPWFDRRFSLFCFSVLLQRDYSFLRDINVWRPFVTIGVYSSTLSAAMSNLIGASRILYALARDDLFGG